jgi:hypothetical protein
MKKQAVIATFDRPRTVSRSSAAQRLRRMRKLGALQRIPGGAARVYIMRGKVTHWHVLVAA